MDAYLHDTHYDVGHHDVHEDGHQDVLEEGQNGELKDGHCGVQEDGQVLEDGQAIQDVLHEKSEQDHLEIWVDAHFEILVEDLDEKQLEDHEE